MSKKLLLMPLLMWLFIPVKAQDNLSKESYEKIYKMEVASDKYAKSAKNLPSEIKATDVVHLKMNFQGWTMCNFHIVADNVMEIESLLTHNKPIYLIVETDEEAPQEGVDELIDVCYAYFTKYASDKRPIIFYSLTRGYEVRSLLTNHNKQYKNIWTILRARQSNIAPPPPAIVPKTIEEIEFIEVIED